MGGVSPDETFGTTRWSLVFAAQSGSASALEEIMAHYREPMVHFVRGLTRIYPTPADPEDIVHDFLHAFFRNDHLQKLKKEKGSLRSWIKTSLKNFLRSHHRKEHAAKRGIHLQSDDPVEDVPDEIDDDRRMMARFDRGWARELFRLAKEELEMDQDKAGKASHFAQLVPFLDPSESGIGYDTAAEALGVSEKAVEMRVLRLRKEFRRILEKQVLATLSDPSELSEEMRYLHQVLSHVGYRKNHSIS